MYPIVTAAPVRRNGVEIGSATCVVRAQGDPTRRYIATAGHLLRVYGAEYSVGGFGVVNVVGKFHGAPADFALLEPTEPIADDAIRLPNGSPVRGMRPYDSLTAGVSVRVFRRGGSQGVPSKVVALRKRVQFRNHEGDVIVHGPMIGIANVTDPGDSGALLIDDADHAVGMLVGEGPFDTPQSRIRVGWYLPIGQLLRAAKVELEKVNEDA